MNVVSGYKLSKDCFLKTGGQSQWGFATKSGHEYFIKRLADVTYPLAEGEISPKMLEKKRKKCEAFYTKKKQLYDALALCRTGNNMIVHDFFRDGSFYYAVTDKVQESTLSVGEIAKLSDDKKTVLIRSILYSVASLHAHHIIHSDIKPDNILVINTTDGYCTAKIIDFDLSFLTYSVPEKIGGDQVYYSPEALLHSKGISITASPAMDMFSLGILFHEYWTGKRPEFDGKYHLACEAVCDDSPITISTSLPNDISLLISKMLLKNPEDRVSAQKALAMLSKNDDAVETETSRSKYTVESGSKSAATSPATSSATKTETSTKVSRGFYRADEFD